MSILSTPDPPNGTQLTSVIFAHFQWPYAHRMRKIDLNERNGDENVYQHLFIYEMYQTAPVPKSMTNNSIFN